MSKQVKDALEKFVDIINTDPDASKDAFEAKVKWVKDMQCECKIRDFPAIIIDEPPKLGGSNQGGNPLELFLSAIGSCITLSIAGFSSMMGLTVDSVEVSVKGHIDFKGFFGLDQNVPSGLSDIKMEVRVKSPEEPEKVMGLIKSAEGVYPLMDTISRSVKIEHENFVNDKKA
jgi:putative redox protein